MPDTPNPEFGLPMPSPELDQAIASKAVREMCNKSVPLGLPFSVIVGLPIEGDFISSAVRAGAGLGNEQNRAFMLEKVKAYLEHWASGEFKPNARAPRS
jgi:hypothetical protein